MTNVGTSELYKTKFETRNSWIYNTLIRHFCLNFGLSIKEQLQNKNLYLFQPHQSKDLSCRHPANKTVYNEPVLTWKPQNSHQCFPIGVRFIQAENRQIILAMRTRRQIRRRINTKRTKLNNSTIGQVCLRFAHAVASIIVLSSLGLLNKERKDCY